MKSPFKSKDQENVSVPWQASMEVKDLIKPITIRRVRLVKTAFACIVGLAAGIFAFWLIFSPPSGETLVKEMIKAAGGIDQWKSIQDGSFVRAHRLYNETGDVIKQSEETFYFKNNPGGQQLLINSKTPQGNQVKVSRDETGYWALRNELEVDPVRLAKEEEFICDDENCSPLCASEMALYRMSFPFRLADYGVRPRNAGKSTLNGKEVILLDVTYDPAIGKDRWVFYVDPATKLIRKIEHYPTLKDNVQPEEVFLSDFKREGNIMLSHSNKYYRSNGRILEEYLITDVKFNSELKSDFFDRPQQISMIAQ